MVRTQTRSPLPGFKITKYTWNFPPVGLRLYAFEVLKLHACTFDSHEVVESVLCWFKIQHSVSPGTAARQRFVSEESPAATRTHRGRFSKGNERLMAFTIVVWFGGFRSNHWIFCSAVWGTIKTVSHVKLNMGTFCFKLDWIRFAAGVSGSGPLGSAGSKTEEQ